MASMFVRAIWAGHGANVALETKDLVQRSLSEADSLQPDAGPGLWAELHQAGAPNADWFAEWLTRVPSYCGCADHFVEILSTNPVRFEDWFAWSVEVHNSVNRHLSKRALTIEAASSIWQS